MMKTLLYRLWSRSRGIDPVLLKKLLIGELSWRRLMTSVLFIYCAFAIYVFFRADSMIFLPQAPSYTDTPEILKIPVNDQERLSAIYLPHPHAQYTLLYIHGNASDLGNIRPLLERLRGYGFSVFAYDYRGYGTSDGFPSEQRAYQDAEVAYQYLIQQLKIPAHQVILYGHSLGGGLVTDLATRHPVAGLILEGTFTSTFRVVVPFPLLPFDKFPNLQKIRNVHCPVLIMHGGVDAIIPLQHSQTLYKAAREPKRFLEIPEAGHDDLPEVGGERYQKALLSFQDLVSGSSTLR
jgi:fermentation-respiration switch protein FrsA (DUF1100 family)